MVRLSAGSRPGGRLTFLVSPRKVSKRRRPRCLRPSASLRATCGARVSRGLAELASLKQLRALIRETLRSSAQPEGGVRAFASLGLAMRFGPSLRSASCSLSLWERVRVRAPGLRCCDGIHRPVPSPQPSPRGRGGNTNAERSDGLLGTHGRAQRRPVGYARPSAAMARPLPSGCAEERRGKRDQGRSCLSGAQRSEFCGPPLSPSTAGCP